MFRSITTDFWLDSKVEDLSSTAKYLLLYLFTNPKTTLTGCYEVSYRRAGSDMGLNATQAEKAMAELCAANVVSYCAETNEVLIRNWDRYNWTKSEKLAKPLAQGIEMVKCVDFRNFLVDKFNKVFPDKYRIDTVSEKGDTVPIGLCTVTVPITGTVKGEGVQGEGDRKRRFSKPSVAEVSAYAEERGHRFFDAEKFVDYYESNGWKVGKNPMRDWKAAVRNWARNDSASPLARKGASDEAYAKYN